MTPHLIEVMLGFAAHVVGGLIAGLVGWFCHAVYERCQRRKQHARFDSDIQRFARTLKDTVRAEDRPKVMAQVVPLASRATFHDSVPPLNQHVELLPTVELRCNICERRVKPEHDGRCGTCKLGHSSWHELRDPEKQGESKSCSNGAGCSV